MRKVYITADVNNPDTEEEFHGWVDLNWSRRQLHENMEDVRFHELEDDEDVQKFIEDLIGAIDSEEDGTFYAADGDMDLETGEVWHYAAHIWKD